MPTCRYLDKFNSRKDMPALKFEIKRKCMKVAWKRRKDEEKKQERLKAIADQAPDYRDYISYIIKEMALT